MTVVMKILNIGIEISMINIYKASIKVRTHKKKADCESNLLFSVIFVCGELYALRA